MSATFKNSKKKLSQAELRKLMSDHKTKAKVTAKIHSPLAKYNDTGQLTCILCQSIVKSDAIWPVHINSKQHRDNVEKAKKLKEKTNNFTTPLKRPLTPPHEVPAKKPKSILKNGTAEREAEAEDAADAEGSHANSKGVPDDFFDSAKVQPPKLVKSSSSKEEKMETEEVDDTKLPEGFFDDPKLDAKARNMEYKDPVEEEWEKFQKEIRDADNESAAIIAEDQEEATTERQIDEIDEQMKNWSRVLTLEHKKTEILPKVNQKAAQAEENDSPSDDEAVFDEYLDWRSKKSFKR